jgi:hypothetical protein
VSGGEQSFSSKRKMDLRVRVLVAIGFASALAQGEYIVPDAKFEALKPRGLRVSIPGMRNIVLWVIMSYRAPLKWRQRVLPKRRQISTRLVYYRFRLHCNVNQLVHNSHHNTVVACVQDVTKPIEMYNVKRLILKSLLHVSAV